MLHRAIVGTAAVAVLCAWPSLMAKAAIFVPVDISVLEVSGQVDGSGFSPIPFDGPSLSWTVPQNEQPFIQGGGTVSLSVSPGAIEFYSEGMYSEKANARVRWDLVFELAIPDFGEATTTLIFVPSVSGTLEGMDPYFSDAFPFGDYVSALLGVEMPALGGASATIGTDPESPYLRGGILVFVPGDTATFGLSLLGNPPPASIETSASSWDHLFRVNIYALAPEPNAVLSGMAALVTLAGQSRLRTQRTQGAERA